MIKRINLAMDYAIFIKLERIAKTTAEISSVTALIIKFIQIGFYVLEIQKDPNKKLIVREGADEKEIVIL